MKGQLVTLTIALIVLPSVYAQTIPFPTVPPKPPAVPVKPAVVADPDPKSLIVSPEQKRKAKELVKQLGNRSYAEREAATKDLRNMGRMALATLNETVQTVSSPEVRYRCEILLPRATADDMKARLACYLADKSNKYDHDLPGAKQFFAAAGNSDGAKKIFRDMLLLPENQLLLTSLSAKGEDLVRVIQERRNQIYGRISSSSGATTLTVLEVATMMFAESCVSEKMIGRANGLTSIAYVLNQPHIRAAFEAEATKEVMTSLIGRWIETREESTSVYQAMNASNTLKLPYALVCAKKLLDPKLAGPPIYRAIAITTIAKAGNTPENLNLLEPILSDEALATNLFVGAKGRVIIQMRDVALAMSLLLTKQDPLTYGMKSRYPAGTANDGIRYSHTNFYFDDADMKADETRKEAMKKWKEWKEKEAEKKK